VNIVVECYDDCMLGLRGIKGLKTNLISPIGSAPANFTTKFDKTYEYQIENEECNCDAVQPLALNM
jgi:hypothetical protein